MISNVWVSHSEKVRSLKYFFANGDIAHVIVYGYNLLLKRYRIICSMIYERVFVPFEKYSDIKLEEIKI